MKGRHLLLGTGLAAALALPLTASATNGYFAHGYGTASKGLAGAGVALPQDAMAPATNPAGIADLGHRMDLGAALFSPRRSYATDSNIGAGATFPLQPGTFDSDSEYFLIPHFGYNRPLGDDRAFGVAVYGNGGMNTDWPNMQNFGGAFPSGTFYNGGAGVDLMQLFVAPTYARRFDDSFALGGSVILAYQSFEANGVGSFAPFSSDGTKLSDNGHDNSYGGGVKFGLLAALTPTLDLGLSVQSKIYMSEFDDYAGLFAEQGDFDIPPTATIGIAWKTSDHSVLVADLQWIGYGTVDSIANPLLPNLATAQLGNNNGAGFGWDDMTILKLGYQWQTAGDWTWRVGYSYGEQPIPSSEVLFNILAPGVIEQHATFGFTKKLQGGSEVHLAAMYAFEKDIRGANPLGDGQSIELTMDQFELELSYTWHFD